MNEIKFICSNHTRKIGLDVSLTLVTECKDNETKAESEHRMRAMSLFYGDVPFRMLSASIFVKVSRWVSSAKNLPPRLKSYSTPKNSKSYDCSYL